MREVVEKLLELEADYLKAIKSLENEFNSKEIALNSVKETLSLKRKAFEEVKKLISSVPDSESVKNQIAVEKEEAQKDMEECRKQLNNKSKSKINIIFKGAGWASKDLKRSREYRNQNQPF